MLTGINHVTIAVKNLDVSLSFYIDLLGLTFKTRWENGAYLDLAGQWICLSVDDVKPSQDYSHLAFDIAEQHFCSFCQHLLDAGVKLWKENKSEGDSLYFLDPDGYKLELHVGDLSSRLASLEINEASQAQLLM